MHPNLILLFVGFLFLGAIAVASLVWALKHTAEGTEDETGFHAVSAAEKAGVQANESASRMSVGNLTAT